MSRSQFTERPRLPMNKKTASILLMSCMLPLLAEPETLVPAPNGTEYIPVELMGSVKAGYSSLYEYRGMVLRDTGSGGMVLDGSLAYAPEVPVSPMVSFTYRDMDVLNSSGQTNFFVGAHTKVAGSREEAQNTFRGGYQLIAGGLPGVIKGWEKKHHLNDSSGTVQELVLNYTSTYSMEHGVLFSSYTGGYAFSGLEGWYLSTSVGYLYPVTEKVSVALTGNISWSFSYWGSTDGCDQANLLFTVPIKVKEDSTFSPFVMLDWGAHNVKNLNRQLERKVVDNFAILAGVSYEISF